jgi:hypothetical protein
MGAVNRPNGVQGTNTSNVNGIITENPTNTGKVGDSKNTNPPAKPGVSETGKSGGSFTENIGKLASEAMTKIVDTFMAAIGATPASAKGDVSSKDVASKSTDSKGDATNNAGDDSDKTEADAGGKEESKFSLAKEAIADIAKTFMAAIGKLSADGKGDVADATGDKGKGVDANGTGKNGEVSKQELAKNAKDAVDKIASAAGLSKGDLATTKGADKDTKTSGKGETNKFDVMKHKDDLIAKLAGTDDSSSNGGFMGVFNVDSKKSDNNLKMAAIKAINNKEDSIA